MCEIKLLNPKQSSTMPNDFTVRTRDRIFLKENTELRSKMKFLIKKRFAEYKDWHAEEDDQLFWIREIRKTRPHLLICLFSWASLEPSKQNLHKYISQSNQCEQKCWRKHSSVCFSQVYSFVGFRLKFQENVNNLLFFHYLVNFSSHSFFSIRPSFHFVSEFLIMSFYVSAVPNF